MAVLTKAQLATELATLFADNTSGDISAEDARIMITDLIDSLGIVVPSITSAQRNLLTPSNGDIIYNTTTGKLEVRSAGQWRPATPPLSISVSCAANPDYPEALQGDRYIVATGGDGKIGGAAGIDVSAGDEFLCIAPNAGGSQGSVGSSWVVIKHYDSNEFKDVKIASVSLSSANILALFTTPIDLIASPGAGKIIMPMQYVLRYNKVTTDYIGEGPLVLKFDGASFPIMNIIVGSQLDTDGDIVIGNLVSGVKGACLAATKLQICVLDANPTGGDSTIDFKLYYKIHTL